jgi:hypothetical protein
MCLQLLSKRNDEEREDMARHSARGRADVHAFAPGKSLTKVPLLWIKVAYSIAPEYNKIPQIKKTHNWIKLSCTWMFGVPRVSSGL